MTANRELLAACAMAAGYAVHSNDDRAPGAYVVIDDEIRHWNPPMDDGDALRLATKLHMTVRCYMGTTVAQIGTPGQRNAYEQATDHADPDAATRLAICLAAAATVA